MGTGTDLDYLHTSYCTKTLQGYKGEGDHVTITHLHRGRDFNDIKSDLNIVHSRVGIVMASPWPRRPLDQTSNEGYPNVNPYTPKDTSVGRGANAGNEAEAPGSGTRDVTGARAPVERYVP